MGKRKGFTLIEIMLFLAVTAALFIGVAMSMQGAIFQQRYNDSTQNFLEFMRSIYSKVSNPQSVGAGNSEEAIYGKLVVFGEGTDLNGEGIDWLNEGAPIFTYDVVGDAETIASGLGTGDIRTMLKRLNINVIRFARNDEDDITSVTLASPEKYDPRWGAAIDSTAGSVFAGSILVVRHPRSGTINTLFYNGTIEVNLNLASAAKGDITYDSLQGLITDHLNSGVEANDFKFAPVNFCVNPEGVNASVNVPKQNIRIVSNARNASGVELIDLDGDDNACVP